MTKKDCWGHKNTYKGQRHQNLEHSHRAQIGGTFWVQDLTHSFNFFLYNRSNTTNSPYNRKDNKVLQFAVHPLLPWRSSSRPKQATLVSCVQLFPRASYTYRAVDRTLPPEVFRCLSHNLVIEELYVDSSKTLSLSDVLVPNTQKPLGSQRRVDSRLLGILATTTGTYPIFHFQVYQKYYSTR